MNPTYNTSIDKILYTQGAYGVHEEFDYYFNEIDFINEYGNRILTNNITNTKVKSKFFRLISVIGIFVASVVSILIIVNVL